MNLVFTVCTNSHLAQAKAMADSLVAYNPAYQVVIGLVDKIANASESEWLRPHTILEIETIQIPDFEALLGKFSLYEMSCLAKPYFAEYLFKTHASLQRLLYFDTDMLIFDAFDDIEASLTQYDIVITPHFTSPFGDHKSPHLRTFLNSGIYNGGFFALRRGDEALRFLKWWQDYVAEDGYVNFCRGMFVDQLCLNFLPVFFKNVLVEHSPRYNVAYWNLHERSVSQRDGNWWVNGTHRLLFFHFSGYQIDAPTHLSVHQDRHEWKVRTDVQPLFELYKQALLKYNHSERLHLPNAYFRKPWHRKLGKIRGWIIVICRKILKMLDA
ncbi:MAG: glycosyl transferase [Spirosomaceae bacterium]|nr:glycosyl transferase [Spirosomataceae bacterium]